MTNYTDDQIGLVREEDEEPEQSANHMVLEAAVEQFTDKLVVVISYPCECKYMVGMWAV